MFDANANGQTSIPLTTPEHGHPVIFSTDRQWVLSFSRSGNARVTNVLTGVHSPPIEGNGEGIRYAAFSRSASRLLIVSRDGTTRLADAITGSIVWTAPAPRKVFPASSGPITWSSNEPYIPSWSPGLSPDGTKVVTAHPTGYLQIWDAAAGIEVLSHIQKKVLGGSGRLAYSDDGSMIIAYNYGGQSNKTLVEAWSSSTKHDIYTFELTGGLTAQEHQSRILYPLSNNTVWTGNIATGREICTLKGHSASVSDVHSNSVGDRLVTGSHDGTVKIWDVRYGTLLLTLHGFTNGAITARFSPDGKRILTVAGNGEVRIWNSVPINRAYMGNTQKASNASSTGR